MTTTENIIPPEILPLNENNSPTSDENTHPNISKVSENPNDKENKSDSLENLLITTGDPKVSLQDRFKQFKKHRHEKFKYQQYLKNKKVHDRGTKEFQDYLRSKFIETAKKYLGVPYAKRYLKPEDPKYNSPIFLDCCGLVRQVVYDLREDFGFTLARWNQAYQIDTLPIDLKFEELRPGDLIFYSGTYYEPKKHKSQRHDMVHVEIFLGGESGESTIGSRWNNGVVSIFDSYKFVSKSYYDIKFYYKSIDTWLQGVCNEKNRSFCEQHPWIDDRDLWTPDKFSVFAEQDQDAIGNGPEEEEKVETLENPKEDKTLKLRNVFIGKGNNDKLVRGYFANEKYLIMDQKQSFSNKYDIKWVQTGAEIDFLSFKEGQQLANHIPNINILGSKNGLITTLRDFESNNPTYNGPKIEEFMPPTFRLDILSDEVLFIKYPSEGVWITKPYYTNQGKNIKIIQDIAAFKEEFLQNKKFYLGEYMTNEIFGSKTAQKIMNAEEEKGNYKKIDTKIIIQKYIENPMLISERKFDIRCYMLIASSKPLFALFHHGYIRMCLKNYNNDLNQKGDYEKLAHLTNNSIQKKHPEYSSLKDQSIWSMSQFEKYLEGQGKTTEQVENIYHQIKRILSHTVKCAELKLDKKIGFFELLGCDIMLDSNMKPYLIEINSNPALFTDTTAQKEIIPAVFNKSLDLVLKLNEDPEKIASLVNNPREIIPDGFSELFNGDFVYNQKIRCQIQVQ